MNIFISIVNYCHGLMKPPRKAVEPLHEKNSAEKAAIRAEDKATEIATKVARMEGRIDPLVQFLNSIHPPSEDEKQRTE